MGGEANFNTPFHPEIAEEAAHWLGRLFKPPAIRSLPIGMGAIGAFIADVAELASADPTLALGDTHSRMPSWSHSADSSHPTGKRVFRFDDATHGKTKITH